MEQTVCGSELPTTGGIQVVVDEYLSGRVRQKQEVKLTLKAVIASVRDGGGSGLPGLPSLSCYHLAARCWWTAFPPLALVSPQY